MNSTNNILLLCVVNLFLSGCGTIKEGAIYRQQEDVVYSSEHGVGLILDVFVPTTKKNGLAIIHNMNGGYYSHDAMREHFRNDFKIYDNFCSHGYTVFSVRPGSITKFSIEEMTENLKTGIRWVKEHADEYSINPDRLGLTGASAGGHLVLLALVTEEKDNPQAKDILKKHGTGVYAAAIFFPISDFLEKDGKVHERAKPLLFQSDPNQYSEEEILAKAIALSPARQVKTVLPPVIFYHGDEDKLPIEHSIKMVEAIRKAGGQVELVTMEGYAHTWPGIDREVGEIADWFNKQLKQ